jgi:hypothetical protein
MRPKRRCRYDDLTRKAVTESLGKLNDLTVADIIAMDATREELAEAHAWITNDEALINAGRALPTGRIARLVELIKERDEEQEEE